MTALLKIVANLSFQWSGIKTRFTKRKKIIYENYRVMETKHVCLRNVLVHFQISSDPRTTVKRVPKL